MKHFLTLLVGIGAICAAAAQPVAEADQLIEQGDFQTALTKLTDLNRDTAKQKFPALSGKEERRFTVLPTPNSSLTMRARAMFERGFADFLDGNHQAAIEKWTVNLQLLSQADETSSGFDLRRVSTALFFAGLANSNPSLETFNRSLKATAEQIDELPLPQRTDIFTHQLKTEFEIYAAYRVLASVFAEQPEAGELDRWSELLARRKLAWLACIPVADSTRLRAYEGIFDGIFFSARNRDRFHDSVIKNSLSSFAMSGPERYSRGLARLAMLQALFFDDVSGKFALDERVRHMADFQWPVFSEELVEILGRLKTAAGADDLRPRLLHPVIPVLNQLILPPNESLSLAQALVETGNAKAGHTYCMTLISRFPEEEWQSRLHALASVALAKSGRFSDALDAAKEVSLPRSLTLDEFAAMTYYRSVSYAQMGDSRASIEESNALLKIAPHHRLASNAHLSMALQYINLGEKDQARSTLAEYLARYPNADAVGFAKRFLAGL